ncbi:MAG: hypothetical protein OSB12_04660 [Planctomycetota bacterium]|nr:hypothetical protein [Planctomycetota bacterium]
MSSHSHTAPSRIHWWLVGACIIVFAADFFYHRHLEPAVEKIEGIPGFYPIYGFIGIAVLVLLSRLLRAAVSRKDGYYDD